MPGSPARPHGVVLQKFAARLSPGNVGTFISPKRLRTASILVIAKTFPLSHIVESFGYLESNQQIGKIVVTV